MTSHVSSESKSSLVKGFVYITGNLTEPVRAREVRLWADAEAILCLLERVGVRFDVSAYERAIALRNAAVICASASGDIPLKITSMHPPLTYGYIAL